MFGSKQETLFCYSGIPPFDPFYPLTMLSLPERKKNGSNLLPLFFMVPSTCAVNFFSICEAIKSKLSIPEHVEPVHNKVQAAKPLLSMIEKYRSHADSLPNENKMKLIMACEDVKQYLSHHFSKNYDPIGWSNFIEETMGIFIRCCEEAIEYKPSSPEHREPVELDQSCNHVDSQTGNPTDAKQTGKSMDGTGKPIERNQTGKPVEPNGQTLGKEPNKQTRETEPTKQTFGWEPNAQTCETGPNKQTRETGPVRQTRGWEPNVQTREIGPNVQTRETGPNVQTRETGPSKQVRETGLSKQVCEIGPNNQVHETVPSNQTLENGLNKQTVNMGQTDKPFDLEQMGIPDHMHVDGGCLSL